MVSRLTFSKFYFFIDEAKAKDNKMRIVSFFVYSLQPKCVGALNVYFTVNPTAMRFRKA